MLSPKQLYGQVISDYYENPRTKEIFYVFDSFSCDSFSGQRTSIEACAFNLRKGQPQVLTLKDFLNLRTLDRTLARQLDDYSNSWQFARKACLEKFQRYIRFQLESKKQKQS